MRHVERPDQWSTLDRVKRRSKELLLAMKAEAMFKSVARDAKREAVIANAMWTRPRNPSAIAIVGTG